MNLCLGTVQFGINYGIQGNSAPSKVETFEILSYAIDNGIELLDTAPLYGASEIILGEFFNAYPCKREKVNVVSKLQSDAFEVNECKHWNDVALNNAKKSLDTIGIRKFDSYLFHNPKYIYDPKAVKALYGVKEAGMADRVGVSVYSPDEAIKALEYREITAIQIPYNVFDQRLDRVEFFQKAEAFDVKVFARSSLLQGLITMNPDDLPSRVGFAKDYVIEFKQICSKFGITPLDAAVSYVGNKKGIDYVVFGVDNLEQLKEYIKIQAIDLPCGMQATIMESFSNVDENVVNPSLWK